MVLIPIRLLNFLLSMKMNMKMIFGLFIHPIPHQIVFLPLWTF